MKFLLRAVSLIALLALMFLSLAACAGADRDAKPSGLPLSGTKLEIIQARGTLIVATCADYAPFTFIDIEAWDESKQSVYVGLDMSLADYIAQQLDVELEVRNMSVEEVLQAVQNDQCDIGVAALAPTDERSNRMDFSSAYYQKPQQSFLVRSEDAQAYDDIEKINAEGVKVAALGEADAQTYMKEQLPEATYTKVTDIDDAVNLLQSGEVDAVLLDRQSAQTYAQYEDLQISGASLHMGESRMSIAIPKGNVDFLEKINTFVQRALEEGLCDQWLEEATQKALDQIEKINNLN
ncbi:MAG: transporter substrate-binding domain-containing protein [Christensenellales bacterium]|jgi:polar amino acid transport system substrate-binding protein